MEPTLVISKTADLAFRLYHLLRFVRSQRATITYGEAAKILGNVQHGLSDAAWAVAWFCDSEGLPKLSALLKGKYGPPGRGFFDLTFIVPVTQEDYPALVLRLLFGDDDYPENVHKAAFEIALNEAKAFKPKS